MKLGDEHRIAMGLGLSGAHRTGKTTVAQVIADANQCPFVMSSATQVAKDMGIKVDIGMPLAERMLFQEEVLRRFEAIYAAESKNGLFVTDRTPLDFAAYVLTDWHPDRSTPELDEQVMDYVGRCMALTGRYFFLVGIIQPGIPYVTGDGKPAPNELYQELLNTTLIGLGADHNVLSHFFLMPREVTKTDERARSLASYYADRLSKYQAFLVDVLPRIQ